MDTTLVIAVASCFVLTALVESSPRVRLPLGLLLAVVLLASGLDLLPVVLLGAAGATSGRALMARDARRGRAHAPRSSVAQAREQALRDRLAASPAYGRLAFTTAALPFIPASFLFSLLGGMRVPLAPALAGSLFGLVPMLAITTTIFRFLGELFAGDGTEPALPLGVFALVLVVIRTASIIDWPHARATGRWRLREPESRFSMFGGMQQRGEPGAQGGHGPAQLPGQGGAGTYGDDALDGDMIEGEVLGEELADDEARDGKGRNDVPPDDETPSPGAERPT